MNAPKFTLNREIQHDGQTYKKGQACPANLKDLFSKKGWLDRQSAVVESNTDDADDNGGDTLVTDENAEANGAAASEGADAPKETAPKAPKKADKKSTKKK